MNLILLTAAPVEDVYATSFASFYLLGIVLFFFNLGLLLRIFIKNKKRFSDTPLNDSAWQIDKNVLYQELEKTIKSNTEKILGILNIQSAHNYVSTGVTDEGFCIMTDKACYFVNKVREKRGTLTYKAKEHKQIMSSTLKEVRTEKLSRQDLFVSTV